MMNSAILLNILHASFRKFTEAEEQMMVVHCSTYRNLNFNKLLNIFSCHPDPTVI